MRGSSTATLGLLLASCKPGAEVPRVVVLVMDGVRVEESFAAGTQTAEGRPTAEVLPRIRAELYPQGALVTGGLTTAATLTSQGHATLLAGRSLPYTNHFTDHEDTYRPALPTLFELLRDTNGQPARSAAFLANAWHIAPLSHSLYPGLGADAGARYELLARGSKLRSDQDTVDAVQAQLRRGAELVVANLHDADRYAHSADLDAYMGAASGLDASVMGLWEWIQDDRVLSEATTLVLVADHGRHRHGYDGDWADHDDACMGCREIPMLLVGNNIQAGVDIEDTATLQDLSATIAALLDVPHPYTDGVPIEAALRFGATTRSGPIARSGAAAQILTDDPDQRSLVEVDGEVLSAGMFAEAPVMAAGSDREAVCWRELARPEAGQDDLPWRPVCYTRATGGAWQDISPPFAEVSFIWEPSLSVHDGAVWLASIDHPTEVDEVPAGGGVWLQSWTPEGGWSPLRDTPPALFYPTHIDAQPDGAGWLVAFSVADTAASSRHGRNIRLYRVSTDGADQQWSALARTETLTSGSGQETGFARHERPALRVDGDTISVAFTGYTEDGSVAVGLLESTDGGERWSTQTVSAGAVFGHIRPAWDASGNLYWAEHGTRASVCRRAPSGARQCAAVGAPYIEGLDAGQEVTVSTHSGDQAWTPQVVRWE